MINLLFSLLVLCLIFGVVFWVLRTVGLPEPFNKIATVILALIFLLFLLGMLFGGVGMPHVRF